MVRKYVRKADKVKPIEQKTAVTVEEKDDLEVEVQADDTPLPQPSLKDRVTGWFAKTEDASPKKKPSRRAGKTTNLLTSVLPTVAAVFVATYSRDMVKDPYKPCAPSKEEVSAIMAPLFEILGREIEIKGKASKNTLDLMNALACALVYGLRAFQTYTTIKEEEKYHASDDRSRGRQDKNARISNAHDSRAESTQAFFTREDVVARDVSDSPTGDREDGSGDAAIISTMLRRDIEGRKRLGLLSNGV